MYIYIYTKVGCRRESAIAGSEGCEAAAQITKTALITITTTPSRLASAAVSPNESSAMATEPTISAHSCERSGRPSRKARPRPPPEQFPAWREAFPTPSVSTARPRSSSRTGLVVAEN